MRCLDLQSGLVSILFMTLDRSQTINMKRLPEFLVLLTAGCLRLLDVVIPEPLDG